MNTTQYHATQQAAQAGYAVAYMEAWQYIRSNWHAPAWTSIPDRYRIVAGLPSSLGMYNGNLVTQAGADSMRRAVLWLNRDRKIN